MCDASGPEGWQDVLCRKGIIDTRVLALVESCHSMAANVPHRCQIAKDQ